MAMDDREESGDGAGGHHPGGGGGGSYRRLYSEDQERGANARQLTDPPDQITVANL